MKKSFVSLLTIAAITFGMVSCNSSKKQDAAEQKVEEEAAIAVLRYHNHKLFLQRYPGPDGM